MKTEGTGVRCTDKAPSADVALWMSIQGDLRAAFINATGSTSSRLLSVARVLIETATRHHKRIDGGPRFMRTR